MGIPHVPGCVQNVADAKENEHRIFFVSYLFESFKNLFLFVTFLEANDTHWILLNLILGTDISICHSTVYHSCCLTAIFSATLLAVAGTR